MKDGFKNFVNENREAFESYEPEVDTSWQAIEQRLDGQQRFSITTWLKVAAVFVILAGMGLTWYVQSRPSLPPRVAEMEAYYGTLTNEKLQFIKSHYENIDPGILQDLDTLDKAYDELKGDLKDDIDNEEVVSAMIQTYRAKLQILEQILDEIQHENESDSTDEISI